MQRLFALTLFLSAALLFWVQPMFSKLLLPALGGVPAVWNTCLVCYQTTLLFGYAFAHLTARWLRLRTQIVTHLILLWGVVFIISFGIESLSSAQTQPILWIFQRFVTSIAIPFFLLSAITPMLQWWFGHTTHPQANNPYVFYAVSNAGSLLALLSYPLLVEPFFSLKTQTQHWRYGYLILALLVSACAFFQLRYGSQSKKDAKMNSLSKPITHRQRLCWIGFALIPSSLLLGVTRHLTTDIAAIPLLWVIPLCIYLLTFVLVFAHPSPLPHVRMLKAQTYLVLPLFVLYLGKMRTSLWLDFPLHLVAFFVFAMVCHGELARSKPEPKQLTEFYFWMSLGGCLGGIFTALLVPVIFHSTIEYPLMIALTCLVRPAQEHTMSRKQVTWMLLVVAAALFLFPAALTIQRQHIIVFFGMVSLLIVTSFGGAIAFAVLKTPKRIAWGVGSFLLGGLILMGTQHDVLIQRRNFFGTLRVIKSPDALFHLFYHGTTLHGAQRVSPEFDNEPLTYFHRNGPLGQIFARLEHQPPRSVAVFGLGVGTIASYIRAGDAVTFYEIDPDVETIAREERWFRYLRDCQGNVRIIPGDARISLQYEPEQRYDMIIQDAFSSDTIPVHLLTREAFQLYKSKLADDGYLLCNITNRYLDLEPILTVLLQDSDMVGFIRRDTELSEEDMEMRKYPSTWVIAAQQAYTLDFLRDAPEWKPLQAHPGNRVWTDDYSNILSVLKFPGQE